MHAVDDAQLGAGRIGQLAIDQRGRNHPDHLAALGQRAFREGAHQAKLAPAIDHANPAPGEGAADLAGQGDPARVRRRGRAAIDGETPHPRSSSISRAVALAPATTPGMPAPGWVAAPTR